MTVKCDVFDCPYNNANYHFCESIIVGINQLGMCSNLAFNNGQVKEYRNNLTNPKESLSIINLEKKEKEEKSDE